MRGDATGRSLSGGTTIAASQYTSVDVTALTAAAAAVEKRRETSVATATHLEPPGENICLDELAPVLEDPADD